MNLMWSNKTIFRMCWWIIWGWRWMDLGRLLTLLNLLSIRWQGKPHQKGKFDFLKKFVSSHRSSLRDDVPPLVCGTNFFQIECRLMLMDVDWYLLMLTDADWRWFILIDTNWSWLKLIEADWCCLMLIHAAWWLL